MDKELIFEILNEWNFWNKPLPITFKRKFYEEDLFKKSKLNEIVVVKGARRSGKSTLLINHIKNLKNKKIPPERILFVNLEDPRFTPYLNLNLLEEIKQCYLYYLNPSEKPIILLDEIQNIPNFEKWLYKEHELQKSNLIITGSNSKLLSKELGSSLSGRYLDVEVMPLSFQEFLSFKNVTVATKADLIANKIKIYRLFEEYLHFGGFPKITLTEEPHLKKEELKIYFESVLLRDIVSRYKLENFAVLQKLAIILLSSISNPISLNSLKNQLSSSFDLIKRYLEYLENAYMIFRVPLFSWSLKKQNANPQKVYSIDNGITSSVSFFSGARIGNLLENLIFLELRRRHSEIYYFKTSKNYEIDFLIKEKEKIKSLIQVCLKIENKKTFKREIRALLNAAEELKFTSNTNLIILTTGKTEELIENNRKITIKNIIEWLLFPEENQ